MNTLIKLEELAQFVLSIFLFTRLDYAWWVYPALIFLPDLSMIGYLANPKTGAWLYNFAHHKLVAISILVAGFLLSEPGVTLAGVILFGHSSMDRILGYGLKYNDNFKNTHLGWIGKKTVQS